jgi:hypothetical protein
VKKNFFKCKKRAEDLIKLSRHQLRTVVADITGHVPVKKHLNITGHVPVKKHLNITGLFDGDPNCRFCKLETETAYHIIFCCEALACQHYNIFGKLLVASKDTGKVSLKDLCRCVRHSVNESVLRE